MVDKDRLERLSETRKALQKKHKDKYGIAHFEKYKLSTGIFMVDRQIGGGLAMGTLAEIMGKSSSGKTSLALRMLAEVNKINYETGEYDFTMENPCGGCFIDAEGTFGEPDTESENSDDTVPGEYWAQLIGFDRYKPYNTVDDVVGGDTIGDTVLSYIKDDAYSVIVIDSIESFFPSQVLEKDMEENEMGLRAKMLYKAIRKWTIALRASRKRNRNKPWRVPLILMLNQAQVKMMEMHLKYISPGGHSKEYYSTYRLFMNRTTVVKDSVAAFGLIELSGHVEKNKLDGMEGASFAYQMALQDCPDHGLKKTQINNAKGIFDAIKDFDLMKIPANGKPGQIEIFGEIYPNQKTFKQRMLDDPEFEKFVWKKTAALF